MLRRIFHIDHIMVTLIALLILGVLSLFVLNVKFFSPFYRSVQNFQLSDMYYRVLLNSGMEEDSPLITIVDVSDLYDRAEIAGVINEINECGPQVLGIDIMFDGLKSDTVGSAMVAEAIMGAECPIVTYSLADYDPNIGEFTNSYHSFFIPSEGIGEGFANVMRESGTLPIRYVASSVSYKGGKAYSFAHEIAKAAAPEIVEDPDAPDMRLIDYSPTRFPVVRYDSVMQSRHLLKDRIVILGVMHDDMDMHYSPYGLCAGTLIQAYAVQTLLEDKRIEEAPSNIVTLVSFFVIMITQIFQSELYRWASRRKNIFVREILKSTILNNFINFSWIAILMWVSFYVFMRHDYYFPSKLMLLAIAMLVEARSLYTIIINTLGKKYGWNIARNSLYKD